MEPIYADLDQIVFEGKEQAYGGYALRRRYRQSLSRALVMVVVPFLMVTVLPKALEWAKRRVADSPGQIIACPMENTLISCVEDWPKKKICDLPYFDSIPQRIVFSIPNPVPEDQLCEPQIFHSPSTRPKKTIPSFAQEGEWVEDYDWDEIDQALATPGPGQPKAEGWEDYIRCNQEPIPLNLAEWKKALGYPPIAYEARISGLVFLMLHIGLEGEYLGHMVIKEPHPILTDHVLKTIKDLKFRPAMHECKPQKFWVNLPIEFRISD